MNIRTLTTKRPSSLFANAWFQPWYHASFSTTLKEEMANTEPSKLSEMFKERKNTSHNIYRHSQHIVSILTTMDNRCRNIESDNPVLSHDQLTPAIVSKFVPDIYKHKDILGRFGGIGSYVEPYRTLLIDQLLRNFIFNTEHSDYHVIEIGIGFDFRVERILSFMQNTEQTIKDINLNLYEIDLPNVLDVRDCLMQEFADHGNFAEDHSKIKIQRTSLRKSVFDTKWISNLSKDIKQKNANREDFSNVIIVTEAFFWLISDSEMENLIRRLSRHFKGATLVFDTKASTKFMRENQGNMFQIQNQCGLLKEVQVRKNVPMFPRFVCNLMSRGTFYVTQLKYL
eukprot:669043_1